MKSTAAEALRLIRAQDVATFNARLYRDNPLRVERHLAEYEAAHERLLALRAEHPSLTLLELSAEETWKEHKGWRA